MSRHRGPVPTRPGAAASGGYLSPHGSMGIRWQDGDHWQDLGLATGVGFIYSDPTGFLVTSSGLIPLATTATDPMWGLSGLLEYDSGSDGLGSLVSFSPAWGTSVDGDSLSLLDGVTDEGFTSGNDRSMRVSAEVGYGVAVMDRKWTLTPFSSVDYDSASQEYSLGSRLSVDRNALFDLELNMLRLADTSTKHQIKTIGSINW